MSDITVMCSSQLPVVESWIDGWPALKVIIPSLITGSIATMAYNVAKTQREIAANKYNLDLFDKRYEVFKEFDPLYNKIKNENIIPLYIKALKNLPEIEDKIKKSAYVYDGISNELIDRVLYDIRMVTKIHEKLSSIIYDNYSYSKKKEDKFISENFISKKSYREYITEKSEEIKKKEHKINTMMEGYENFSKEKKHFIDRNKHPTEVALKRLKEEKKEKEKPFKSGFNIIRLLRHLKFKEKQYFVNIKKDIDNIYSTMRQELDVSMRPYKKYKEKTIKNS
ncbi:hypothetical protein [Acetobacter sp.]|uniref:hypothetical protein n=1 Tax=Acetobacter sp. TaxID=440 RepID=UPI002588B71E|nr:hypothetical protein [Acetobacter sp.]MCC6104350.1 hypothetical protein [Acetobacter sp.]